MKKIDEKYFSAWKDVVSEPSVSLLQRGRVIECTALCVDLHQSRSNDSIQSAGYCNLKALQPAHIIALKSYSNIERYIGVSGSASGSSIEFNCNSCGAGQNFDKECRVPPMKSNEAPIVGIVAIDIKPQKNVDPTEVCISGSVVVFAGKSDPSRDMRSTDYEIDLNL